MVGSLRGPDHRPERVTPPEEDRRSGRRGGPGFTGSGHTNDDVVSHGANTVIASIKQHAAVCIVYMGLPFTRPGQKDAQMGFLSREGVVCFV